MNLTPIMARYQLPYIYVFVRIKVLESNFNGYPTLQFSQLLPSLKVEKEVFQYWFLVEKKARSVAPISLLITVPRTGLEPAPANADMALNHARLPIPPPGHKKRRLPVFSDLTGARTQDPLLKREMLYQLSYQILKNFESANIKIISFDKSNYL